MMMPGRTYSAESGYRYGFNGKENDNEVKGEGNQQDYGMRIYDSRIGKFLSVDPIIKKYPELTPYQFASNRPIDGIDLDGLEYKSAADWAQRNLANYTFGWDDVGVDVIPFKRLRKSTWRDAVGNYMFCATSTSLAYAQGNSRVAAYLQSHRFETNRIGKDKGQFVSFTKHKDDKHYLIKPKDNANADRGDLIFLQDPNSSEQNSGHVAILATNTRTKVNGGFTVNVYSTNAGVSADPTRESNTFGEAIYFFTKNDNGEYQLTTKYYKNIDNGTWLSKDMREENLILQGFGRVDEEKIKNPQKKVPKPKPANSSNTSNN